MGQSWFPKTVPLPNLTQQRRSFKCSNLKMINNLTGRGDGGSRQTIRVEDMGRLATSLCLALKNCKGTGDRIKGLLIERFRITFTANGKREFVPREQFFSLLVFNCSLLLQKKRLLSHYFHLTKLFWTVLISLFSVLTNSQLESAVCLLL